MLVVRCLKQSKQIAVNLSSLFCHHRHHRRRHQQHQQHQHQFIIIVTILNDCVMFLNIFIIAHTVCITTYPILEAI